MRETRSRVLDHLLNPVMSVPFVSSILHPSDLSETGAEAFAHALALALLRQTQFTVLHARAPGADSAWRHAPSVRRTLEQWGLLAPGSPRSAVFEQLAIDVRKVDLGGDAPMQAILKYLEDHQVDLLVVGTEGREGLPRWLKPSFAEQVSRRSQTLTLFVPHSARGFVSWDTGQITLNRILIPVDRTPPPTAALTYGVRAAHLLEDVTEITLLHMGEDPFSWPQCPEDPTVVWHQDQRRGAVVEGILTIADQIQADLIIMTTQGHLGIWDAVRGSTTEQVVRQAPCAVLVVPQHLAQG